MLKKYRIEWDETYDALCIELACFRHGHVEANGGLGMAGHFREAVNLIWGEHNKRKHFIWHPWAEKMLHEACRHKYLSVSGPGGVGKTDFFALWGIINWLCDPVNTMVVVTSTTLNASRKRIWGSVTEYFNAMDAPPGKLVDSLGIIRTFDEASRLKGSDKSGIALVAGEASHEKESMDKLIGCHNKRVILIGDELPALSHSLVKFATTNLSSNPYFQFIGIGNPRSKFDPHGLLSTPKAGWSSVGEHDYEWETELGYAIRFDAEQSPNVLEGKVIYPWLPKLEDILLSKHRNGPDSLEHWSQCRGFWPPEGTDPDCIYSEADIADSDATQINVKWIGNPIPVAFCDPAWTHGGDACRAVFGLLGTTDKGTQTLLVTEEAQINDAKKDPRPRIFQIADQYIKMCRERGVIPKHAGYDSTGGGALFGDIMAELWDNSVYALNFAGPPTDMPHGSQGLPGTEQFADRVTEIWMVGKDYLRSEQLKGISTDIIRDMLARKEVGNKRGMSGIKRAVEPKRVMKKRIKRSPDCFVAGTMILTPGGEVPIESLREGDIVCTPMGNSPVVIIHKSTASELTEIRTTDGRSLRGKGSHKVFTRDAGWVPMRNLELTSELESSRSMGIWRILSSLFTRAENTDFKPAVDTIKTATGAALPKDFFTESSGLSAMALFLKVCASIIKMVIGLIIPLKIWNSCKRKIICGFMPFIDGAILNTPLRAGSISSRQSSRLPHGTDQKREGRGTGSTGKIRLEESVNLCGKNVASVARNFTQRRNIFKNVAPWNVASRYTPECDQQSRGRALFAGLVLWLKNILKFAPVRLSAEPTSEEAVAEVFNLTLLRENAYYANGLLVANCGDAFFGMLDLCRKVLKFRSNIAKVLNRQGKAIWSASQARDAFVEETAMPTNVGDLVASYRPQRKEKWELEADEESDWTKVFSE